LRKAIRSWLCLYFNNSNRVSRGRGAAHRLERRRLRDEALALLRPYEEKYPNSGISLQWFALAYALMGDEPNTMKWLERSADRHEWQALAIAVHPVFAPMRNSPGFRALEKRMGLSQ